MFATVTRVASKIKSPLRNDISFDYVIEVFADSTFFYVILSFLRLFVASIRPLNNTIRTLDRESAFTFSR
jgi:hypothetical protein